MRSCRGAMSTGAAAKGNNLSVPPCSDSHPAAVKRETPSAENQLQTEIQEENLDAIQLQWATSASKASR